jgi:hypothetical protein
MCEIELHIKYLRAAELQFRLASAVRLAATFQVQLRDLPIKWSHGKHVVRYEEIAVSMVKRIAALITCTAPLHFSWPLR